MTEDRRMEIIRKVRSLLDLAGSDNGAEALAATLKAQELLAKYKLDKSDLYEDEVDEIIEHTVDMPRSNWCRVLATVVGENFRCRSILCQNYLYKIEFRFIGHSTDVQIATTTYEYLKLTAETLYSKIYADYYANGKINKPHKMSYMVGFIDGVAAKLSEGSTYLQLTVPSDVDEYISNKNVGKGQSCGYTHHADSYNQGRIDEKDAINSSRLSGTRMLTGG